MEAHPGPHLLLRLQLRIIRLHIPFATPKRPRSTIPRHPPEFQRRYPRKTRVPEDQCIVLLMPQGAQSPQQSLVTLRSRRLVDRRLREAIIPIDRLRLLPSTRLPPKFHLTMSMSHVLREPPVLLLVFLHGDNRQVTRALS